ncbi:hypothetical protein M0R19_05825 [Candidatus Pacearchaeota archaeon]|jgi:hypothetical protein|nr:hypothetical protein [Candidatus Pacearchaeota archaeon]
MKQRIDEFGIVLNHSTLQIEDGYESGITTNDIVDYINSLKQKILDLEKWIDNLQEGTIITCVYCGHAYPPGTQTSRRKVLYEHIKICPKHPLREAEERIKELEMRLIKYGNI